MSTTQRSESMNAFFDGYVNSRTSLKAFVEKYDSALHSKWEKEKQEDFRCWNTKPKLITGLYFESQFAEVYTLNIFYLFQKEIKLLMGCSSELCVADDNMSEFQVGELNSNKKYLVRWCKETNEYDCECKMFQFRGIICRHGLSVYRQLGIDVLPHSYVLNRWRKDFIRGHLSQVVPDPPQLRDIQKYDVLYARSHQVLLDILEIASQRADLGHTLLSGLVTLRDQILFDDEPVVHPSARPQECNSIKDPVVARSKGRPRSRRFVSSFEKVTNRRQKRTKKCASTMVIALLRPIYYFLILNRIYQLLPGPYYQNCSLNLVLIITHMISQEVLPYHLCYAIVEGLNGRFAIISYWIEIK
jgi:SWIM zinc finger